MTDIKTKIDAHTWYNLNDIFKYKMFSWVKSFSSVRTIVEKDGAAKNILSPNIKGEGRGTKYNFKGENIIKFITFDFKNETYK